ncbi:MAG: hypothetical protein NTW87_16295 [Planctomycetota bacterium]|nr:hypothetical protein [Planctomycetota bacterium]
MKRRRIPHTDSVRELAAFWDTHELTAFNRELEEVHGKVFERAAGAAVIVDLKPAEAAAVKQLAKASKIGCKPLLRKWIVERLHQETVGRTR